MSVSARGLESLEARRLFADTLVAKVDVANVHQTVDALGVALNSGWQPSEYRSADFINKVVGDLGVTAVRSALDPGWETTNDDSSPNTYNWAKFDDTAIATTMEFFAQAKARGVTNFLLTVWTPPGWMKTNKAATNGAQLRPDEREEYAEYIAAAVIRAKTKWGVDITQVSIANEPYFTEPYVSSMWTPATYRETLKVVAAKFQREGLTNVQFVGPEDVASIYRTKKYVEAVAADPVANAEMPIIASHYLQDQDMQTLAAEAATLNKKIWYSEVGNGSPTLAGAIGLARGIDSAFVRGNASAWINWQLSGTSSYESLMSGQTPNPKYYALKQFAHFVRPGMQRVDVGYVGDTVRVAAFHDPVTGALTIVMSSNRTTDVDVNLSLAGTTIPTGFEEYRTSATENCADVGAVAGAANMTVTLAANSIITLYSGPALNTPVLTTASAKVIPNQWADAWNTNPLRMAAEKGDIDTVKSLIAGGADVNAAFGNGWTPLFCAAASPYNKADQVVAYLLDHGADPLHRDVEGATVLHVAAMSGIPAFGTVANIAGNKITRLLAAGIPVDARDGYGRTALHYAAMVPALGASFTVSDTGMLKALIAAGADQTATDNLGRTPRDWAVAESATDAIALLSPPGSIEAHVFSDYNASSAQDAGETGLAGVNVYIDLNGNALQDPDEPFAATDANGVATFSNLLIGNYTLHAAAPDATSYTTLDAAATVTVTSNAGVIAALPFVPVAPPPPPPPPAGTAQLSGYVVNDKNADGKWGSGEVGVAGRTVFLDTNGNGTLDTGEPTQVTATNGKYIFAGIGAGTYTIREILPAGWTQTRPAAGAAFVVTIKDAVIRSGLDFATNGAAVPPPPPPVPGTGTASIKAYLINDKNLDGKWSGGETGLAGRTVWLDLDNDAVIDAGEPTATTGVNGVFSFTALAAATYSIRHVLPAGWTQTYPAANAALTIKLTDGQAKSGNSLGTAATVV